MKKKVVITILQFLLLTPLLVQAQTPTPAEISTLGPLQVRSAGDIGTNVQILAPQNKSSLSNPIQLIFFVKASLLPYSPFGNVGYSLDGGTIYGVSSFINRTLTRDVSSDDVTVWAEVALPKLSEGSHSVTVYVGWQFSGIGQRYEVVAYSNVIFLLSSKSPTPTPTPTSNPTLQPTDNVGPHVNYDVGNLPYAIGIVAIGIVALVSLAVYFKKYHKRSNLTE